MTWTYMNMYVIKVPVDLYSMEILYGKKQDPSENHT